MLSKFTKLMNKKEKKEEQEELVRSLDSDADASSLEMTVIEDEQEETLTQQDMKKLSRLDLLAILLEQGKENEKLREETKKAKSEFKLAEEKLQNTRDELERCGARVEKLKEELKKADDESYQKLKSTQDELERCGKRVEQLKLEIKKADEEIVILKSQGINGEVQELTEKPTYINTVIDDSEIRKSSEIIDEYFDRFEGKYNKVLENVLYKYEELQIEYEKQKNITAELSKEKETMRVSLLSFKKNLEKYSNVYPEFKQVLELMEEQEITV